MRRSHTCGGEVQCGRNTQAPPGQQTRALNSAGPDLRLGHREECLMALILLVLLLALILGGLGFVLHVL